MNAEGLIPPWLRDGLKEEPADFYGQIVLHVKDGHTVHAEIHKGMKAPTTVTTVSVRRGG